MPKDNIKQNKDLLSIGDRVTFQCDGTAKKGIIFIVDADGTFERPGIPSYDIWVEEDDTLYKHVMESYVCGYIK